MDSGLLSNIRRHHANSILQRELSDLVQLHEPSEAVLYQRAQTVARVQEAICSEYGSQYMVESFGSTKYGASSAKSDLDLSIIDLERMHGFEPNVDLGSLPAIYDILSVESTLRKAGFPVIKSVTSASVPIVKFRDPNSGVECDININEQLGVLNTRMLKRYCDISPHLRPLLLAIKTWAKPLGLNNPSSKGFSRSFSSYAFALMTIGFLQHKTLLPNLQEGLSEPDENLDDGTFWTKSQKGQSRVRCDTRYHNADGWVPPEGVAVDDLLVDWFRYWGHEHRYDDTLLDIRRGGFLPRKKIPARKFKNPSNKREVAEQNVPDENRRDLEDPEDPQTKIDMEEFDTLEDDASSPANDIAAFCDPPLDAGEEPLEWIHHFICIIDPFIRRKNVTQNIRLPIFRRFQIDCQRAALLLSEGASLKDLPGKPRKRKPAGVISHSRKQNVVQIKENKQEGKQKAVEIKESKQEDKQKAVQIKESKQEDKQKAVQIKESKPEGKQKAGKEGKKEGKQKKSKKKDGPKSKEGKDPQKKGQTSTGRANLPALNTPAPLQSLGAGRSTA